MPDPIDPSKPAAGGWTPTPAQRALGIGVVASLGGMIPVCLDLPSPWNKVGAGGCAALALGIGTALGLQSAGPRSGI